MAKYITVKAGPKVKKPGEVALWERDEAHPNGEIFVANDGTSVKVSETAAVSQALASRRLARVGASSDDDEDEPQAAEAAASESAEAESSGGKSGGRAKPQSADYAHDTSPIRR